MSDITLQYSILDTTAKREVRDFIDYLLSKSRTIKRKTLPAYKKKILSVSIWTDEDMKVFNENRKLFNQWKVEEW